MRVGVAIEETWSFFTEVFEDLKANHETSLFKRRFTRSPWLQSWLNNYLFHHDMERFLREHDVVFFEWASELLAYATRFPKTCGIVTRLHRYELYHWADQINWDRVDRIIVVSQAKKEEFTQRFPEQAEKIVVIPEAVSLNKFSLQEKPFGFDIGILCWLTPRKRVYELILAFYELNRKVSGYTLHIGGGRHPRFGDYYEALRHLVTDLKLEDRVIFYGDVTDAPAWYSKIDIFISNSYSEGLQVSPMEAIASGVYCLSHRWDGAAELLPEENLFQTENELICKILDYAQASPEDQKARKQRLLNQVQDRFDMQKIKVQIRSVVEEVGERATR